MDSQLKHFTDSLDPTRKAQWEKLRRYEKSITFWFGIAVLGGLLTMGAWVGILFSSGLTALAFAIGTCPGGLIVGFATSRARRHQKEKRNFVEKVATWPIPRQQWPIPKQQESAPSVVDD